MLPKETLYQEYIVKGLTAREVGQKYGLSENQIKVLLRNYGIKRDLPSNYTGQKAPLTKEFLVEQYIILNKTMVQIMQEFSLSESKVRKSLIRYNIKKPWELKQRKGDPKLKTKEALEKMYFQDSFSIVQIAEILDLDPSNVTDMFRRRGIPINKTWRYQRVRRNDELRIIGNIIKRFKKKFLRSLDRIRNIRKGKPMSLESKIKSGLTHVAIASVKKRRTKPEQELAVLLKSFNVSFEEQCPMAFYDMDSESIEATFCVDFYVEKYKSSKFPIIIHMDGRFPHSRPIRKERDDLEDTLSLDFFYLAVKLPREKVSPEQLNKPLDEIEESLRTKFNTSRHIVIRIRDNEVTRENVGMLLAIAEKRVNPSILRFKGVFKEPMIQRKLEDIEVYDPYYDNGSSIYGDI